MNDVVTIAHLSDLHLGSSALDTGRSDKATATAFWKKAHLEMQTHDGFIFATLRSELKSAARLVGAVDDGIDMYVVTGEISTTTTPPERFSFARQFLVGTIPLNPKFAAELNLDPNIVICVPVNHDKMTEQTPERYLNAFGSLPEPPPFFLKREIRGRTFLFFRH